MDQKQKTPWLCESSCLNPYYNQALEKFFIENTPPSQKILFIYRNRPSVIIGKNQNPWVETSPDFLKKRGTDLLRRYSGGGAVYHDPGNINFSLILPREEGQKEQFFELLQGVLEKSGLKKSEIRGNSLFYNDKKISGSAYYIKKKRVLLHGTLLVHSDLSELSISLKADPDLKITSRAVDSIRAKVANCSEFSRGLSPEKIIQETKSYLISNKSLFIEKPLSSNWLDLKLIKYYEKQLLSWNWLYGLTPAFNCTLNLDNPTGITKKNLITLIICSGIIEQISINDNIISNVNDFKGLINLKGEIFNATKIKTML